MPEHSMGTASTRWERRRRLRTVLLVLIAASLPCYCLGWVALNNRDRLRPVDTTSTPTETPQAMLFPSLTPYLTLAPIATITLSPVPSLTPTITLSPTISPSPSTTFTATATSTHTLTSTATPTASLTPVAPAATLHPTLIPSGGVTSTAPPP